MPSTAICVVRLKCYALLFAAAITTGAEESPPADKMPPAPEPLIQSSGKILGVGIGTPMKEARERLNPLREKTDGPLDVKEKMGTRVYWKLVETEYDWVIAWANRDGKIIRLRAVFRPDKLKPFAEIGDLATSVKSGPNMAVWDVVRETGSFRLTAAGEEGRAARISLLAFDPNLPEPDANE